MLTNLMAHHDAGLINIASLKADFPWETLPPNTTFVDVGAGQGNGDHVAIMRGIQVLNIRISQIGYEWNKEQPVGIPPELLPSGAGNG